ncbi:hypothetical protein ACLKA7_015723 [Drosophila subpalustris]
MSLSLKQLQEMGIHSTTIGEIWKEQCSPLYSGSLSHLHPRRNQFQLLGKAHAPVPHAQPLPNSERTERTERSRENGATGGVKHNLQRN